MNLLLVGADGFLGRHVAAALATAGLPALCAPPVTELDLVTGGAAAVDHLLERATGSRPEPLTVLNCAGAVAGDAGFLHRANVDLPRLLLAGLAARGPGGRFVHLGSAAEYGPQRAGTAIAPDADCAPGSEYGRSKLAGTRTVLAGATESGTDAVVLRVFNPVGGGQPAGSLPGRIAAAVRELPAGATIRTGPLTAVRDVVAADDVAAAVLAAATAAGPLGAMVLNVGSGRPTPMRDLVSRIVAEAGRGHQIVEEAGGSARSLDVDWSLAEIGATSARLGWRPRRDLADTVRDLLGTGPVAVPVPVPAGGPAR